MGGLGLLLFALLYFVLITTVASHGYVKSWASEDLKFQKAQKQPLSDTAFRNAPSNTGWIGSQFINTPAFVCGASETPKDKVAPPGGTMFSASDQSAKKTMPVKAGSKVSLIVAGNPGEGFPHPTGHMLAYLGYCGKSSTACQDFDASKTEYHRIQAEADGISKLRKQFNSEQDGHRWDVPIPKDIVDGSYILRIEMIAFDQSSSEEGRQDQYYVFCGQIAVKEGTGSTPVPNDDQPTVKLPGAFKSGNISPKSLPSPLKLVADLSAKESNSKKKFSEKSFEKDEREEDLSTNSSKDSSTKSPTNSSKDSSKDSSTDSDPPPPPPSSSSSENKDKTSTICGDRCFKKKITELTDLAPSCSANQLTCLCKSQKFVKAYQSCCNDHCQGLRETRAAVNNIYIKCDSAQSSFESDDR